MFDSVLLHYLINEKIRHHLLVHLLCYFVIHLIIEEKIKQTHCVRYSTKIDSNFLHYLNGEKIRKYVVAHYSVNWRYNFSIQSEWSRHTILAILYWFIQLCCIIWPVHNQKLCVIKFTVIICRAFGHLSVNEADTIC